MRETHKVMQGPRPGLLPDQKEHQSHARMHYVLTPIHLCWCRWQGQLTGWQLHGTQQQQQQDLRQW